MMRKFNFADYTAPEVEVISTAVEAGFAQSVVDDNDFADAPYNNAGEF